MKTTGPGVALLFGGVLAVSLLAAIFGVSSIRHLDLSSSPARKAPLDAAALDAKTPATDAPTTSSAPDTTTRAAESTQSPPQNQTDQTGQTGEQIAKLVAFRGSPRLDDHPSDWSAAVSVKSSATVSGNGTEVTASWQLLWDHSALYLRAAVHDPQIVQPFANDPGQLYRGDSVSLELGDDAAKLSGKDPLRDGDAHYLFGPLPGGGVVSAVNHASGETFVSGKKDDRVKSTEHSTDGGYVILMAIPWKVIGAEPDNGKKLAANLNVSDGSQSGDLVAMKSTNPLRASSNQTHPGTWQTLELHK